MTSYAAAKAAEEQALASGSHQDIVLARERLHQVTMSLLAGSKKKFAKTGDEVQFARQDAMNDRRRLGVLRMRELELQQKILDLGNALRDLRRRGAGSSDPQLFAEIEKLTEDKKILLQELEKEKNKLEIMKKELKNQEEENAMLDELEKELKKEQEKSSKLQIELNNTIALLTAANQAKNALENQAVTKEMVPAERKEFQRNLELMQARVNELEKSLGNTAKELEITLEKQKLQVGQIEKVQEAEKKNIDDAEKQIEGVVGEEKQKEQAPPGPLDEKLVALSNVLNGLEAMNKPQGKVAEQAEVARLVKSMITSIKENLKKYENTERVAILNFLLTKLMTGSEYISEGDPSADSRNQGEAKKYNGKFVDVIPLESKLDLKKKNVLHIGGYPALVYLMKTKENDNVIEKIIDAYGMDSQILQSEVFVFPPERTFFRAFFGKEAKDIKKASDTKDAPKTIKFEFNIESAKKFFGHAIATEFTKWRQNVNRYAGLRETVAVEAETMIAIIKKIFFTPLTFKDKTMTVFQLLGERPKIDGQYIKSAAAATVQTEALVKPVGILANSPLAYLQAQVREYKFRVGLRGIRRVEQERDVEKISQRDLGAYQFAQAAIDLAMKMPVGDQALHQKPASIENTRLAGAFPMIMVIPQQEAPGDAAAREKFVETAILAGDETILRSVDTDAPLVLANYAVRAHYRKVTDARGRVVLDTDGLVIGDRMFTVLRRKHLTKGLILFVDSWAGVPTRGVDKDLGGKQPAIAEPVYRSLPPQPKQPEGSEILANPSAPLPPPLPPRPEWMKTPSNVSAASVFEQWAASGDHNTLTVFARSLADAEKTNMHFWENSLGDRRRQFDVFVDATASLANSFIVDRAGGHVVWPNSRAGEAAPKVDEHIVMRAPVNANVQTIIHATPTITGLVERLQSGAYDHTDEDFLHAVEQNEHVLDSAGLVSWGKRKYYQQQVKRWQKALDKATKNGATKDAEKAQAKIDEYEQKLLDLGDESTYTKANQSALPEFTIVSQIKILEKRALKKKINVLKKQITAKKGSLKSIQSTIEHLEEQKKDLEDELSKLSSSQKTTLYPASVTRTLLESGDYCDGQELLLASAKYHGIPLVAKTGTHGDFPSDKFPKFLPYGASLEYEKKFPTLSVFNQKLRECDYFDKLNDYQGTILFAIIDWPTDGGSVCPYIFKSGGFVAFTQRLTSKTATMERYDGSSTVVHMTVDDSKSFATVHIEDIDKTLYVKNEFGYRVTTEGGSIFFCQLAKPTTTSTLQKEQRSPSSDDDDDEDLFEHEKYKRTLAIDDDDASIDDEKIKNLVTGVCCSITENDDNLTVGQIDNLHKLIDVGTTATRECLRSYLPVIESAMSAVNLPSSKDNLDELRYRLS